MSVGREGRVRLVPFAGGQLPVLLAAKIIDPQVPRAFLFSFLVDDCIPGRGPIRLAAVSIFIGLSYILRLEQADRHPPDDTVRPVTHDVGLEYDRLPVRRHGRLVGGILLIGCELFQASASVTADREDFVMLLPRRRKYNLVGSCIPGRARLSDVGSPIKHQIADGGLLQVVDQYVGRSFVVSTPAKTRE